MTYFPQQTNQGQYPQQPAYGYGYAAPPLKHSGLGLASLIIGCIAGVGLFICIVVAAVGVSRNPAIAEDGPSPFDDPNWMQNDPDGTLMMVALAGCSIFGFLLLNIVGLIFGLVGTFSSNTKRTLGIIGLTINVLSILAVGGLLILGMVS